MIAIQHYICFCLLYHISSAAHIVEGIPVKSVDLGENVTIHCAITEENHRPLQWWKDSKKIEANEKINIIENDGYFLQIVDVDNDDTGLYQCLAQTGNTGRENYHTYTVLVSVHEIYIDMHYGDNIVRGVVASLVFIAMFAVTCGIYKYRWRSKQSDEEAYIEYHDGRVEMRRNLGKQGIDNPIIEMESSPTLTRM